MSNIPMHTGIEARPKPLLYSGRRQAWEGNMNFEFSEEQELLREQARGF